MPISAAGTTQVESMKNKKSLWIAGIAALLLLVFCLAVLFHGKNWEPVQTGKDIPTIRILTIGECNSDALARVSAELSQITQERVGCRVELHMIREDEYDERIDDLLLESNFADIFVCRNRTTMNKLMAGSYIYRLDRYLNRCPQLRAAISDAGAWEGVQSQGYTYAIPFGNGESSAWGFLMRKDICDSLNIDPAAITTLEQLHEVLLQVQEAYPDVISVVSDYGETQTFADMDLLTEGAGCLIADGQVVNVCALPEFQERCAVMAQWYEEGLMLRSAQLNQAGRDRWMADGMAFGSFAQLSRYTVRELEYALGTSVECAVLNEDYYGGANSDLSFVIYAYTEDVDLCLRVLQMIYTDEEALRLCIYGQEGVDYTLSEQGVVLPASHCEYYNWYWPMRDCVPAPVSVVDPVWYEASVEDTFRFDNRTVSNEIYQCGEVLEKYYEALCAGVIPAEEGIARMRDELKSANQGAIQAELERQWLDWKKEH